MQASAFIVQSGDGFGEALTKVAQRLGFESVRRYSGLSRAAQEAERTPLVFFLCAAVADVMSLKPMADAIRFSASRKLRFAPMIYFAPSPSLDVIKACIAMGFDDVIALPFTSGNLGGRLSRQVGQRQIYYETPTYFGPDRRNRDGGPVRSSGSDHGGGQYRRFEIVRNPTTGVDVISDDTQIVL